VRLLLGGDDSPPIKQKSQAAGFAAIAVSSLSIE